MIVFFTFLVPLLLVFRQTFGYPSLCILFTSLCLLRHYNQWTICSHFYLCWRPPYKYETVLRHQFGKDSVMESPCYKRSHITLYRSWLTCKVHLWKVRVAFCLGGSSFSNCKLFFIPSTVTWCIFLTSYDMPLVTIQPFLCGRSPLG